MKIIILCVVAAIAIFYGGHKYFSQRSNWGYSSGGRSSSSGGADLRVDTPAGKMYPGLPRFGTTTINGKRYTTITTVRSR
jgi:hypothetical protein